MENSMKAKGPFVTQFCNMELNFVNMRVQNYMEAKGYLNQPQLTKYNMQGNNPYLICVYISRWSNSLNPKKIYIKYFVKQLNEHENYITSCEISGFIEYVINFYIGFWPTPLSFDDCKKGESVNNFFTFDRIGLSVDLAKSTARIKIEKNKNFVDNSLK